MQKIILYAEKYILNTAVHTSRISLILFPPLPMREPHWLAGITNLKLIGGRITFPAPEFCAFASYEKETQSLDL